MQKSEYNLEILPRRWACVALLPVFWVTLMSYAIVTQDARLMVDLPTDNYLPSQWPHGWLLPWMRWPRCDSRWFSFRQNVFGLGWTDQGATFKVPLLTLIFIIFLLASWLARRSRSVRGRLLLYAIFGVIFTAAAQGVCYTVFLILPIVAVNFILARVLAGVSVFPALLWLLNVAALFLFFTVGFWFQYGSQQGEGAWFPYALSWKEWNDATFPVMLGFRGIMPWNVARFLPLRMISYGYDCHLAARSRKSLEPPRPAKDPLTALDADLDADGYSILNFCAYTFYPILSWAGPVITFNAFIAQTRVIRWEMPSKITAKQVARYWVQGVLLPAFVLELMLQLMYCLYSFNQNQRFMAELGSREGYSNAATAFVAVYGRLFEEWLVLMVLWRFCRALSLTDGIEVHENMVGCIGFMYRFSEFWRCWHASLNRWAVRYLYVPLGGNKNPIVAALTVFLFVAAWHDAEGLNGWQQAYRRFVLKVPDKPFWDGGKWYLWAILNACGVLGERILFIRPAYAVSVWTRHGRDSWTGVAQAVVGGLSVILLILANVPVCANLFDYTTWLSRLFPLNAFGCAFFFLLWLAFANTAHLVYSFKETLPKLPPPPSPPQEEECIVGDGSEACTNSMTELAPRASL